MDNVSIPSAPAPVEIPVITDPRVWIAAPAYGSKVDSAWMTSVLNCFFQLQCVADYQIWNGDSLVCRARNNLCSMFLEGKPTKVILQQGTAPVDRIVRYDWMLFIDTDLIFQPHEVQMLYDLATRKGPGIYAGTYPLKTIRPKIVYNPRNNTAPDESGVVSVHEAGTGFMMIHRQCLEQMRKAYPQNDYTRDNGDVASAGPGHDWFQVGVYHQDNRPSRYLSEDWYFCRKWIDMGGDIYMQTKICANHIGMISYPINPSEILEVAHVYQEALDKKKDRIAKKKAEEAEEAVASAA